jgi:hypothetical protein
MKSDDTTTLAYHPLHIALLLVLALGGSVFPLQYACSAHEASKHYLALIVAVAIPMSWIFLVRMNLKIRKIHDLMGQNSGEMQGGVRVLRQTTLSVYFALYLIIIVLSSNLFASWK